MISTFGLVVDVILLWIAIGLVVGWFMPATLLFCRPAKVVGKVKVWGMVATTLIWPFGLLLLAWALCCEIGIDLKRHSQRNEKVN